MSERRYDPTHGEWVTFATDRQDRTYKPSAAACPLCPTRPSHEPTEIPRERFDIAVFDNRFPSLSTRPPEPAIVGTDLVPVEPWFGFSTSYLMGIHGAPTDGTDRDVTHLHLEICPPHRGGGKLKYLAGSETFGGAYLTDVAPEVAAEGLRTACVDVEVPA